jgi:NADH-quinone oxidoreductase subunit J
VHVDPFTGLLATATVPDAITFIVAAVISLGGAVGVVLSRSPVHSALMLVLTLFGVAVLFVAQDAQFLAAVQIIVYAGAIVVLFLFVIMLLGVDLRERLFSETLRHQGPIAVVLGVLILVEVLLLARTKWPVGASTLNAPATGGAGNTAALGTSLFTTYLLPFEMTSVLLVIAVIAAVVLARRHGAGELGEPERGTAARRGRPAASEVAEESEEVDSFTDAPPALLPGDSVPVGDVDDSEGVEEGIDPEGVKEGVGDPVSRLR